MECDINCTGGQFIVHGSFVAQNQADIGLKLSIMDGKVFLIKSDTDYAMRMLVSLALREGNSPVTAADLTEGQNIPVDFAYKILQKLRRANIIKSFKGVNGGFSLAKKPCDISLLDVVDAVQGRILLRHCLIDDDNCVTA